MNKDEFKRLFKYTDSKVNNETKLRVISRMIDPDPIDIHGIRNLVIVMEECGELIQQLALAQVGICDRLSLIEELADVELGVECIKFLCNIEEDHKPVRHTVNETNIEKFNDISAYDNPIYALGELQTKISKYIRGKSDQNEMQTVVKKAYATIDRIMLIYNINTAELTRAMHIKLDRISIYMMKNPNGCYL